MEYIKKTIKEGINVHYIKTDLFKTDLITVFLTNKLSRETITTNTLIPAVLVSGSKTMPTQLDISKTLENLYGAELDCGIDKTGDNHVMKFYIESINNKYIITNENLLKEVIEKLLEIIFNPILENGTFKEEYVNKEKDKIKQLIEGKIDNKDKYAQDRCVEETYKQELYGLNKFGYVEDLRDINAKDLYDKYIELINNSKIDIFISGDFNEEAVEKIITENENIEKLKQRTPDFAINNETTEVKEEKEENIVEEKLEIGQGKLVISLDIMENRENTRFILSLYNTILGGSANSKLFQNLREKESLAYAIGSVYLRPKNNIFIKAGIEIENYEKTIELAKKQLEDMRNGDFTEDEIEKAKKFISYGIQSIREDQETGITYYIGQELSGVCLSPEEYLNEINKVTKKDIVDIANKIKINTIYFLKNS